ncbi:hypothetical protein F4810DRAFT_711567 [Camillea tinctor]|nr:hypothetical protein F4810DRAFT_711567 [Camillea tinctor]
MHLLTGLILGTLATLCAGRVTVPFLKSVHDLAASNPISVRLNSNLFTFSPIDQQLKRDMTFPPLTPFPVLLFLGRPLHRVRLRRPPHLGPLRVRVLPHGRADGARVGAAGQVRCDGGTSISWSVYGAEG